MRCFIFYILLFLYYCFVFRKPSFGMRCPCDMQNVKRGKNMFFSDKVCGTPLCSTVILGVQSLRKIRKKKETHGKPRKTKGNSVAFTILFSFYFILFLSSITQTYLIEDPGIQGSTLRLVIYGPR